MVVKFRFVNISYELLENQQKIKQAAKYCMKILIFNKAKEIKKYFIYKSTFITLFLCAYKID